MMFDIDDAARLDANGVLDDVILHEMGHVIGVGTMWNTVNMGFANTQAVYTAGSGFFAGSAGNAAYTREIKVCVIVVRLLLNLLVILQGNVASQIPVELGGGRGTANAHWDEVDGGKCCTGALEKTRLFVVFKKSACRSFGNACQQCHGRDQRVDGCCCCYCCTGFGLVV
jgi:hypothetical protein